MAQQQQRYRIIERIAAGGMAEVYRAESAGLEGFKKIVAIKRVLPHLSEKKQFIGMFLDEARTSAHLSHSNCVQVFDIGVGDNTYFIVMEYVDGADLKAVIENCREKGELVPIEAACLICIKICEGLDYAHSVSDEEGNVLGIVHRDMSPPNVLITKHGEVKIVDFGLAKANSQLEKSEPGIIKGKFSYLSPEAALGETVDGRTDVFAVGIMLWEMLAGRRLFLGESDLETVRQVQAAQVPSLRPFNPAVSPDLERVVARALARDPAQRYQTARDFGRDLSSIMFDFGRAVSSFDIADLVQEAVSARAADKKRRKDPKASIIGTLIDEAMLEFTSLDKDADVGGGEGAPEMGSAPLNIGAFGSSSSPDWGSELGGSADGGGSSALPSDYDLGNLAALEDDAPGVPLDRAARADQQQMKRSSSTPPAGPVPAPAGGSGPAAAAQEQGGSGGVVAIVLVLLAAAGAAGAYFGGLF